MTLLAVPAAMLGCLAAYLVVNPARDREVFVTYVTVLVTLCGVGGLEAGALVLWLLRERDRRWRLEREREAAEKTARFTASRLQDLEQEVDRLTAETQVYRAGRREEALQECLRVVRDLAQADEVTLFLREPDGEALAAQMLVDAEGSYTGEALAERNPDDDGVAECFQHQSAFQTVEGDRLRLLVPVSLEGRSLGVLAATVRLVGEAESQARLADGARLFLEDIAPQVASVVNTTILREQALTDPLTKLGNRAQFDRKLQQEVALAQRRGRNLSLVMIDLDHFKRVNDTYGHQTGDEVLSTVGAILRENLRTYDTAYRYGGEELALILPETAERNARVLVERVRKYVKRHPFRSPRGKTFYVTLSAGIAEFDRRRMRTPEELIARADAALYQAKSAGRDRVALASSIPASTSPSRPRQKQPPKPRKERT